MTNSAPTTAAPSSRPGTLFGIPIGELGWFSSLLMGTATGFAAFFFGTFLGIISILIYNTSTHHTVDFTLSYRRVGLPLGLITLAIAYTFLATLWTRRILRKA